MVCVSAEIEVMVQQIKIRTSKLRKLVSDHEMTAAAVNLKYVNDAEAGITRVSDKEGFVYLSDGAEVTDEQVLLRIKKLVIPPAWTNVWICKCAEGHLQATGIDAMGRKQYRYHALWNTLRNHTKFSHLYDFGNALPTIRKQLQKDMSLPGMPLQKVLATIVALMQQTCIRIGNSAYEKLYGSFGLTTMKDNHVKVEGSEIRFAFKGKKGVYHNISLRSRRLARIVRQCKDIPGKELFQYYDEGGERKSIDSGMVNNYISSICDSHFTSKDFRTWAGTLYAFDALRELGCCDSTSAAKRNIVEALDIVAGRLGNTRAVCRKYYVHPAILGHYEDNTIGKYFKRVLQSDIAGDPYELNAEEKVLMKMLKEDCTATLDVSQ